MFNSLKLYFSNLFANSQEDFLPQNGVVLNIRARGLQEETRVSLFRIAFASFIYTWIIALSLLPISLIVNIPSTLISLILSFVASFVFELSTKQLIFVIFCFLIFFNHKAFEKHIFLFLFDLLDVLSFGTCTKFWTNLYLSLTLERQRNIWANKDLSFLYHFSTSRQLNEKNPKVIEELQFVTSYRKSTDKEREKLVESYWDSLPNA